MGFDFTLETPDQCCYLLSQSGHSLPAHYFSVYDCRPPPNRVIQHVVDHDVLVVLDCLKLLQRRFEPADDRFLSLRLSLAETVEHDFSGRRQNEDRHHAWE